MADQADIEPQLVSDHLVSDHEDWEIIEALGRRGDVAGFITNDAKMLTQAPEMVALQKTRLALIITESVGHDPIRATGLVMVQLQQIAKQLAGGPARICVLKPSPLLPIPAATVVNRVADRLGLRANEMVSGEAAKMRAHLDQQRDETSDRAR